MKQLEELAKHAAQHRIRGRSYKRNSLLKPLAIIFEELERCPDPQNDNERELVRASSKGMISEHIKRIASGVHEEDIYRYVDLFFDGVLKEAHHGNANRLLQRERTLRSAYLVYMREALAEIFQANGKARTKDEAMATMDATDEEADTDEA
jgi:hypothetical protein